MQCHFQGIIENVEMLFVFKHPYFCYSSLIKSLPTNLFNLS